jgi:hypothetical protein
MNPLKRIFDDLIDKLSFAGPTESGSTAVLSMLKLISKALEDGDLKAAQMTCGQLNEYWLQSVGWCSELSKDIEKCLIAFEEHFPGR